MTVIEGRSSPLLGRHAEVARAQELVDRLPGGGGALLVQGPAGSPAIAPFLSGAATPGVPFLTSFTAAAEGRHVLTARLSNAGDPPARLYLKVDYMGPATSTLF